MISQNLKDFLIARSTRSSLEFLKLVTFLDGLEYEFIGTNLRGPIGVATYKKAYFDMSQLRYGDDKLVFFSILHEYCHILRINKIGKDGMINCLSTNDIYSFIDHIVYEEILADRFACVMFYVLNKQFFPRYRTQMLDIMEYKAKYINQNKDLFGVIKDEETYDALLNSFIIDGVD